MKLSHMQLAIVLVALLVVPSMLLSATWDHHAGAFGSAATTTVNAQHTAFGSWVRACSTGDTTAAAFTAVDSGILITEVTGIVTLGVNQSLWVGIDTAEGSTDTAFGYAEVARGPLKVAPSIKVPFTYVHSAVVDSADTVDNRVVALSAGSSTDSYVVTNLKVKVSLISLAN